jgi:hypothetical protein
LKTAILAAWHEYGFADVHPQNQNRPAAIFSIGERIKDRGERNLQISSVPVVYLISFAAGWGLPSLHSGMSAP